jgi:hypothetical protein
MLWMAKVKSGAGREPLFMEHPGDLGTDEAEDKLASAVGDAIVRLVQADRKRRGLPPLPDK